jgi:hypothetical protein
VIGYVVTFALGYGFARVVDNPERARSAARAVAGEGRRIKAAFSDRDGRASGRKKLSRGRRR